MTYSKVEMEILRKAETIGILKIDKMKHFETMENINDDIRAGLAWGEKDKTIHAIGEMGMSLIYLCAILDVNFVDCLELAHERS